MKPVAHIGLVILRDPEDPTEPELIETLIDADEISLFQHALDTEAPDPISALHEARARFRAEAEAFGDLVEAMVTRPFAPPKLLQHAADWFKSRIRYEWYSEVERRAAQSIAALALSLYSRDPERSVFWLETPAAAVRVQVFVGTPTEQLAERVRVSA